MKEKNSLLVPITARFSKYEEALIDELVTSSGTNRSSVIRTALQSYVEEPVIESHFMNFREYLVTDFRLSLLQDLFEVISAVADLSSIEKKEIEENVLRKLSCK